MPEVAALLFSARQSGESSFRADAFPYCAHDIVPTLGKQIVFEPQASGRASGSHPARPSRRRETAIGVIRIRTIAAIGTAIRTAIVATGLPIAIVTIVGTGIETMIAVASIATTISTIAAAFTGTMAATETMAVTTRPRETRVIGTDSTPARTTRSADRATIRSDRTFTETVMAAMATTEEVTRLRLIVTDSFGAMTKGTGATAATIATATTVGAGPSEERKRNVSGVQALSVSVL